MGSSPVLTSSSIHTTRASHRPLLAIALLAPDKLGSRTRVMGHTKTRAMLLRSRKSRRGPRGAEQPGPNMDPPCASSPGAASQCSHSVCHGSLNNQGVHTNKTKKPSVSLETSHKQRARPGSLMELDTVNHSTSCSLSNLGQICTLASRHRLILRSTCCTSAQGLLCCCF